MKYILVAVLFMGCATYTNPNDKIHSCMLELIDRGVHADIAQRACSRTFTRGDSHTALENYIKSRYE